MLETDTLLQLLANEHRRRLLRGLAADERDTVGLGDDPQTELEMYHVHLPKLEEAELVEWDRDDETVVPGSEFETARRFLRLVDEAEDGTAREHLEQGA